MSDYQGQGDQGDDQADEGEPMPASATIRTTQAAAPPATATVDATKPAPTIAWRTTIRGADLAITVTATGAGLSRADLTERAAGAAHLIQSGLRLVQRAQGGRSVVAELARALVPQQAAAAVRAAGAVARLARSGRLRSALRGLRGGARVIGRALLDGGR